MQPKPAQAIGSERRPDCVWHEMEGEMQAAATRYVGSFIAEFITDFMCFCVNNYGLSTEEVAIVCLVASESTRTIRTDPFLIRNFGGEDFALPETERPTVSLKVICAALCLSRETARRKVASLVERGFLKQGKGGVYMASQTGEDDYTKDLRIFLSRKLEVLNSYRNKMPG